ncbi:MAG: SHOCT domain-containing protein [Dermatophilaceae bacterium]
MSMDEKVAQLKQLAELKDQGILTDKEFEAQKAKILGQ